MKKTSGLFAIAALSLSNLTFALAVPPPMGMDHTPPLMPQLAEKKTYTVTGAENWEVRTGFGRNQDMVGMMILMMVGGSGMEGMKMGAMKMDFGLANFQETAADHAGVDHASADYADDSGVLTAKTDTLHVTATLPDGVLAIGDNIVDLLLTDPATDQPIVGAVLSAAVEMTSMDMGVTKPAVKEIGNGHYQTTVEFSMKGPWRLHLSAELPGQKQATTADLDFAVGGTPAAAKVTSGISVKTVDKPGVGDNTLQITLRDAAGKPIPKAQVSVSVEMTSMDMGVAKPKVKEIGKGVYETTVEFSMFGPWRVTVTAKAPGQKPLVKNVDFAVPKPQR